MNKKTLNVEASSLEEDLEQFAKVWRDAEAGKRVKAYAGIGFESAVELISTLTPKRWLLIEALKSTGAQSIYALAKHLSRNYSNVHTDVTKLLELGIVEKDEAGKVFVPWDKVDVRFPLQRLAA
jgi:predicted transcriptional regulator